ncbi:hypothetical protein BOTBODRAFT_342097 [Botryobasidium botryosum FD-172 SS1]|uniref:Post-SET domain-containing protein n=1 Tax=Botryobasidium botryosum (strain FD-172 SS1) TaxID=930990 RepID=A0A067MS98_BOTB1|nr:hypothetical protein BOTBODRAFT_342097 [Botryobasidium botryosum FD-172 SS1]
MLGIAFYYYTLSQFPYKRIVAALTPRLEPILFCFCGRDNCQGSLGHCVMASRQERSPSFQAAIIYRLARTASFTLFSAYLFRADRPTPTC